MTPAARARNEAQTRCFGCGFVLGRLLNDREHAQFTPGIAMVVRIAGAGSQTELICPQCGQRRSYTGVTFVAEAIAYQPELHRAKLPGKSSAT